MKIPSICRKMASFDNDRAGWYARNSVRVQDVVPEWITPGGGVCSSELESDLIKALKKSIRYSKQRVAEAESHIKKLERAIRDIESEVESG